MFEAIKGLVYNFLKGKNVVITEEEVMGLESQLDRIAEDSQLSTVRSESISHSQMYADFTPMKTQTILGASQSACLLKNITNTQQNEDRLINSCGKATIKYLQQLKQPDQSIHEVYTIKVNMDKYAEKVYKQLLQK